MKHSPLLKFVCLLILAMAFSIVFTSCNKSNATEQNTEQQALALVATARTTRESSAQSVSFQPLSFSGLSNENEPTPYPEGYLPTPPPQPTAQPVVIQPTVPLQIAHVNPVEPTQELIPIVIVPTQQPDSPESYPVSASILVSGQVATSIPRFGFPEAEPNPFVESPVEAPAVQPADPAAPATAVENAPLYTPVVVNPKADGANWRALPVVPEHISKTAMDIYRYGVEKMGRNGRFFSKIGDCHSFENVFLGEYDYQVGSYTLSDSDLYLEHAINYFQGAFNSLSYAVSNGMSAASALTTIWSDPYACNYGESALLCEVRIHNPSLIFINLGTNWVIGTDTAVYEDYLDEIVFKLIQNGVLPILTTKADNIEGNNMLNQITVAIAQKYDLPVFNFWAEAQKLPNGGLDATRDNIHLAAESWPIRSYWALKVLYKIGHDLNLF
jgi:hypothetical protein